MAAAIDFKNPTLVVVGHWNAAILNEAGWIAKNILEVPEGKQVGLNAVEVGKQVGPTQLAPEKLIWLLDCFGLACTGQRVEMFIRDADKLQPLYEAVRKLAQLLPHTPTSAVGINFDVLISEDAAAVTPALETTEDFDTFGVTSNQDRTDRIVITNKDLLEVDGFGKIQTALNLTRGTDFKIANIKFNYHLQMGGMGLLEKLAEADVISHWRSHAMRVLEETYGIDAVENSYL